MTSYSIVDYGQISLNGYTYNLAGPVRSSLSSRFANKIVIGQEDMNAHENVSYLRWADWSEGIGLREFYSSGGEAPKRAWYSDCHLTNPGHLTLGSLATLTAPLPTPGYYLATVAGGNVPALCIFLNELYVLMINTVDTSSEFRVYKYDDTNDSWGSELHSLTSGSLQQADMISGFIDGVDTLVICGGTSYAWSTDGTSWNTDTANVMQLTIHDDALWGIDSTGLFWSSTTLGTEISKAALPVPSVPVASATIIPYISDLVTIPDASGEMRIHAGTAFGLYSYDQTNDEWTKTNIALPEAKYNCRGTRLWNGDIYIPAGMGLYRAIYGTSTQIFPIGPDQDHGLPAIHRGAIVDLAPGHDILAVALSGDFTGFRHYVSDAATLQSLIMAYNGVGWQVLWEANNPNEYCRKVLIGSAYSKYRLWFSTDQGVSGNRVYYIDLPTERVDSHEAGTREYSLTGVIETPRFHIGQDVNGLALSILVEPHEVSENEVITILYRVNEDTSYTLVGAINTAGDKEFILPTESDVVGVEFQSIQLRVALSRNPATTTNRPFLHGLTLKFLKAIPDRHRHLVTLDLSRDIDGQSPRDQWRNLRSMLRENTLVNFTFRDSPLLNVEDRYFVRVNQFNSTMQTGLNYGGTVELDLVEVQHPAVGFSWNVGIWDQADTLWG